MLLKRFRMIVLLLIIGIGQLGWTTSVQAHGGSTSAPQSYVQVVGSYEITVLMKSVTSIPGPLDVEITAPYDIINTTLFLQGMPAGTSLSDHSQAKVRFIAGETGPYFARLQVDQEGAWDLALCLPEMAKNECPLIPFTVDRPVTEPSVLLLYSVFAILSVIVLSGILATIIAGWLRRSIPRPVIWIFGQGAIICLTVAITVAAYMAFVPSTRGSQNVNGPLSSVAGRPYVNAELVSLPAQPVADEPLALTLRLTDGSTGYPVDDLVPHHDALMHLIVISADGGFFLHTHPARLAPGHYQIGFTPDRPGIYQVALEVERKDSGSQMVMQTLEVGGLAQPADQVSFPGLETQQLIEGIQAQISASRNPIIANKPATLTFHFVRDGQPVKDIQPWLGMAGHLLMRSPDGVFLAHVHAAGSMSVPASVPPSLPALLGGSEANSTGITPEARFGPDIQFVYTFPRQGTYQAWMQFQYAHQIITIPFQIEVFAP